MRLFVLILAALLLPVPALAEQWKQIHADFKEFVVYYIDTESLYKQGDSHVRAWVKKEDLAKKAICNSLDECDKKPNPQECRKGLESSCPGGKPENYNKLTLYEASCTGQMRILRYDIGTEKIGDWFYVTPGSLSALVEKEACKK